MNKVLIVDDNMDIRELLQKALQMMCYESTTVSTREEALLRLKKHEYDAIILDWAMNGMKIEDFLAALKKMKKAPPVILCTAANNAPAKARALGLTRYIGKPFDLAMLDATIRGSLVSSV